MRIKCNTFQQCEEMVMALMHNSLDFSVQAIWKYPNNKNSQYGGGIDHYIVSIEEPIKRLKDGGRMWDPDLYPDGPWKMADENTGSEEK